MLSSYYLEYFPVFVFFIVGSILSIVILTLSYVVAQQSGDVEKLSA